MRTTAQRNSVKIRVWKRRRKTKNQKPKRENIHQILPLPSTLALFLSCCSARAFQNLPETPGPSRRSTTMDSSSQDPPTTHPQPQRQQLQQHLMEGGNPNPISNPGGAAAEATNSGALSFSSSLSFISHDEDMSRVSALNTFKLKEEEIEKRKLEIREKVMSHLGRVEEETKRLATIREELETLSDPMGKEVALVRKRIDAVNKELKPLGHLCQKKEKEYNEALDAFNEKNKEKVQLINKLMELSSESEKVRMKRLEELSMTVQ